MTSHSQVKLEYIAVDSEAFFAYKIGEVLKLAYLRKPSFHKFDVRLVENDVNFGYKLQDKLLHSKIIQSTETKKQNLFDILTILINHFCTNLSENCGNNEKELDFYYNLNFTKLSSKILCNKSRTFKQELYNLFSI